MAFRSEPFGHSQGVAISFLRNCGFFASAQTLSSNLGQNHPRKREKKLIMNEAMVFLLFFYTSMFILFSGFPRSFVLGGGWASCLLL